MKSFVLIWIAAFVAGFFLGDAHGVVWALDQVQQIEASR